MTTRIIYLEELKDLNQAVIRMGTMLEQAIEETSAALKTLDVKKAEDIIERDDLIDNMERNIEQLCIHIIAKQQPVATDLRQITSIMRIISDLERIADHCSDISEYILKIADGPEIPAPKHLEDMIREMKKMVKKTIDSFVEGDLKKADEVVNHDDIVDDYFESIKTELCNAMRRDPERIPQYADYLLIVKYVERMADHSTNIAQWISFIVTGDLEI